jgi:hypothetical protein
MSIVLTSTNTAKAFTLQSKQGINITGNTGKVMACTYLGGNAHYISTNCLGLAKMCDLLYASNNCTSTECTGDFTLDNPNETWYQAGYAAGISDYNQNVNDPNHHFECPIAHLTPHGEYCLGYDAALKYMFSDH